VLAGSATFEALAREHSADGSAAAAADLGWARPGMFVPEFEEAMDALAPGGISQPLVSRFGVHIIQVLERREVQLSAREQREVARNVVRQRNAERDYLQWAEDVRGRAYVEYREPPQ
jgi:peptidyl-prolyl cis-trans isomerase SurA